LAAPQCAIIEAQGRTCLAAKPAYTNDRLNKHDRQVVAIRELFHEGMRLVIDTGKDMRALAIMQKETAAA